MRFSNKIIKILLLYLFSAALLFRYPLTNHPIGSDSFMNFALAEAITESGNLPWFLHITSVIGIYPFSVCSGGLIHLSAFSQLTSLEMEYSLLVISQIYGLIGTFSIFMLMNQVSRNPFAAIVVAFIFSTSNVFKGWTTWDLSFRGSFIAVLPLFILFCFRLFNKERFENRIVNGIVCASLLFMLMTIHKMFFYIPINLIFFALYFFVAPKIKMNLIMYKTFSISLLMFVSFFSIIFSVSGYSFWDPSYNLYQYGDRAYFFQGQSVIVILLNMSIDYAIGLGIIFPFVALGIPAIVYSKKVKSDVLLAYFLILPFLFILCDASYVRTYIAPFLSILIGLGVFFLFENLDLRKSSKLFFVLFILFFSAVLPNFVVIRDTDDLTLEEHKFNKAHNAGIYMGHQGDGGIVVYGESRLIAAYSGKTTWSDGAMDLVINGIIDESFTNNFTYVESNLSFGDIMNDEGSIWETEDWVVGELGYFPGRHKLMLQELEVDSVYARNMLSIFDTNHAIFSMNTDKTVFLNSTIENKYMTYDDSWNQIYSI